MPLLYQKLTEIPVFLPRITDSSIISKQNHQINDRRKKSHQATFSYLNLSKNPFLPEPETSIPLALAKA